MVDSGAWSSQAAIDTEALMMSKTSSHAKHAPSTSGFTLTELLVAVGIVGILSAVALPNYSNSINKAKRTDAYNLITLIQNTAQAYREEYLQVPNSWDDLAKITPIPTGCGPASGPWGGTAGGTGECSNTGAIIEPNGNYLISVQENGPIIDINATPIRGGEAWTVIGCLDLETGYSAIKNGGDSPICTDSSGESE